VVVLVLSCPLLLRMLLVELLLLPLLLLLLLLSAAMLEHLLLSAAMLEHLLLLLLQLLGCRLPAEPTAFGSTAAAAAAA
jgi:hypothetical protein